MILYINMTAHYLMKSEGDCYPISQLKKDKISAWSGVRNYQARNYMREMKIGDMILFYHSNTKPVGVYGLASVCAIAHPDLSAQDVKDEHFDPKATKQKPIWECVDVMYISTYAKPVTLEEMKKVEKLSHMKIFQKGSRLSIMPVTESEYEIICKMSKSE